MSNASAIEIDKQATVYIPYGYNKKNKYDVVYLCHGYGANLNTFLGTQDSPRQFKNILDKLFSYLIFIFKTELNWYIPTSVK